MVSIFAFRLSPCAWLLHRAPGTPEAIRGGGPGVRTRRQPGPSAATRLFLLGPGLLANSDVEGARLASEAKIFAPNQVATARHRNRPFFSVQIEDHVQQLSVPSRPRRS